MTSDAKLACADMTFADAIQDYAAEHDVPEASVRDMLIASGAYDALYDEGTGLWAEGPDALIAFHRALMAGGAREAPLPALG